MSAQTFDSETGEVIPANTIVQAQERAAFDSAVDIAKRHPRTVQKFKDELRSWATEDRDVADSCYYAKPQGDTKLIGPSIRFAELAGVAWGNMATETRIVGEEDGHVIVEGTSRDLERNVTRRDQVRRSILTRAGKRFPQHMVETTIAAASAIAARNSILKVVPQALWKPIFESTLKVAMGERMTLESARVEVLGQLDKKGVPRDRVYLYLGGRQPDDMTRSDVLALQAKDRLLERDESTIGVEFPEARKEDPETAAESRQAANEKLSKLGNGGGEKPAQASTEPLPDSLEGEPLKTPLASVPVDNQRPAPDGSVQGGFVDGGGDDQPLQGSSADGPADDAKRGFDEPADFNFGE